MSGVEFLGEFSHVYLNNKLSWVDSKKTLVDFSLKYLKWRGVRYGLMWWGEQCITVSHNS